MITEIRFYRKSNYGVEQVYLIDCAEPIARLTGCRTLRDRDMDALKELGFTFQEVLKSSVEVMA